MPNGHVEIKALAPFGDIEVVVPDGVSVELTGVALFGRKKPSSRRRLYEYGPSRVRERAGPQLMGGSRTGGTARIAETRARTFLLGMS